MEVTAKGAIEVTKLFLKALVKFTKFAVEKIKEHGPGAITQLKLTANESARFIKEKAPMIGQSIQKAVSSKGRV